MTVFNLHPNLQSKIFLKDLPLCRVLLEDNSYYPWVFLVPRINNVSKIMDLKPQDQLQLLSELDLVQNALWKLFTPKQLNVAAIGNKTDQLHIHIICRYENDPAWPNTVWEHLQKDCYKEYEKKSLIDKIIEQLKDLNTLPASDIYTGSA